MFNKKMKRFFTRYRMQTVGLNTFFTISLVALL
jgi:hypothetical protein